MARLPEPTAGLVIRYSYLWRSEHQHGLEEGRKDRPCAFVLVARTDNRSTIVTVLPITHQPPSSTDSAIEIPTDTKRRLGLDGERSWIVLTEANRFRWPGPDIRRVNPDVPDSFVFGQIPHKMFLRVKETLLVEALARRATIVPRTE